MVDCSNVRAALLDERDSFQGELESHAAECAACRELLAEHARLGRLLAAAHRAVGTVPEGKLAGAVARDVERDRGILGRLRALSTPRRIGLAIIVTAVPLAILSIGNPRLFTPARFTTVGFAILLAAGLSSLLAPLYQIRRRSRQVALAAVALALPTVRFLLIGKAGPVANDGWTCLAVGILASAPLFAVLHAIVRRSKSSLLEVALAGAIAGLSGNMALQLHCIDKRLGHLLASHASITLAWVICGLIVHFSIAPLRARDRGVPY